MAVHPEIRALIERVSSNTVAPEVDDEDIDFIKATTVAHAVGHSLLGDLRLRRIPKFVKVIDEAAEHDAIAPMPHQLETVIESVPHIGISTALSKLTSAGTVVLNSRQQRYVSGDTDNAREFADPHVTTFMENLFHRVANATGASLAAHDFYHAHVIVDVVDREAAARYPIPTQEQVDLGLLFHTKEHPREYTLSTAAIPPMGVAIFDASSYLLISM